MRRARILLAITLALIYSTLGVVRTATNFLRDSGYLRISVVAAFAIAASVTLFLIFRHRRNRTRRVVLGLLGMGALYAAVIYPMKSPEEKIHFIEYGVVALLADASMPRAWTSRKRFIASALFVLAAGWIDEGIQALLPSRFYDLRDVAFNAAAGLLALVALAICFPRERTVGTDRSEEVAHDASR